MDLFGDTAAILISIALDSYDGMLRGGGEQISNEETERTFCCIGLKESIRERMRGQKWMDAM